MEEPRYHLAGVVHAREETMEDFDGPLDLILLLLSKNKMEIQDISISLILDQYLAFLEEQKKMDMEIASEFITMASHLMLIKTKMLLSYSEQQEAMSEMEQLIQSLTERQQQEAMREIRSALPFMEEHNYTGAYSFVKGPEPFEADQTYRYSHEPSDLLLALSQISERRERALPPTSLQFVGVVGREPYSVTKKTGELLKRLLVWGKAKFSKLFEGSKSRSEIVATFLSVLELCKVRSLFVRTGEDGEDEIEFMNMPEQSEVEE